MPSLSSAPASAPSSARDEPPEGQNSRDAACCSALGTMARGQDHRHATDLVADVYPSGKDAAKQLARLLSLKEASQYGAKPISAADRRGALRQGANLIAFADEALGS